MKILTFWDIYWRVGRNAFLKELPSLREKYKPDFIIVNVDNISSWRGPIEKHLIELENAWVDLMTSWDHVFDNIEKVTDYLNKENSKLIRACNYFENDNYKIPWKWMKVLNKNWKKLLVIHLMATSWMKDMCYNPFLKLEQILKENEFNNIDWIIVDFHKEYTSEIYWMAFAFDGKISFCYWTHTHIQSNDEMILDKWTAVMNDLWMSGSQYSVIWADFKSVEQRFFTWINRWKITQSLDLRYVVNWAFIEITDFKCTKIEKIKITWNL